jgi:3-oxoacyl-[acyl-carrier protein] reductase
MRETLEGRVALVTGAGRNLGRAMALALAEAGARVAVNARANRGEALAVVGEIEAAGSEGLAVLGDVGDRAAIVSMVEEVSKRFGSVDLLVNNAGIRPRQSFLEIEPEDWDRVLRTNLTSVFACSRAVVEPMIEQGFGRIINITGVDGVGGAPHRAHNVACKAGMIGLTKALAVELGHSGITVNAVAPGAFDTTRDPRNYPEWPPPPAFFETLPVPRLGQPEEVGALCAFLASEAAGYITGQTIHTNGGMLMP